MRTISLKTKKPVRKKKPIKRSAPAPAVDQTPQREDLIADIKRIQEENPSATITRDFYRVHGRYSEGIITGFFPKFSDFRKAAGLVGDADKEAKDKEVIDSELVLRDKYVYNEDTDTYITFLDRCGTRVQFSGATHRSMLQAYSNWDGQPQTINEICRTFGIKRDWFNEYKAVHGWTHDKEPFTNEELLSRPEEDMVADALQSRRLSLFKKFEKEKWLETKQDADKWRDFEQNVFLPLMGHIEKNAPNYKVPQLSIPKAPKPYALVVAPFDLHYGKHGWIDETGESYSRAEARELLMLHTQRLTDQVMRMGRPEKIIVASASDWLHIDNQQGGTTVGTPQDTDGTRSQILIEGCELAKDHVEFLRQIAPVEWLKVNGNHDYDSAFSIMMYLYAWYRNDKDVTIHMDPKPRQYSLYGNSLLGFGHGDTIKPANLHGVMTREAKELWRQSDFQYFFTGHLHHMVEHEINGITHIQLSSLSGQDRWHKRGGYVTSSRALQAFMVSEDQGIVAEFISPHVDQTVPTGVKIKNPKKK